jgi:predicted transcriptional regulator
MESIHSPDELVQKMKEMDKNHSSREVFIPGKGRFTIVFQEEDPPSIHSEVERNPELKQMIEDSLKAYEEGRFQTTSELIDSLSNEKQPRSQK